MKFLFVLTIVLPLTALADWRFREYDKNTGITYRLDYESIKETGDYVFFRTLIDLNRPFANGTVSIEQHHKANCDNHQITWEKKFFYADSRGMGKIIKQDKNTNLRWGYALSGSFYDRSLNFVCDFVTPNN